MLLLLWVVCCMLFLCYDLDDTCRFLLYLCCDTWFMLFMCDMPKFLIVVVLLHMLHDVVFFVICCISLHVLSYALHTLRSPDTAYLLHICCSWYIVRVLVFS